MKKFSLLFISLFMVFTSAQSQGDAFGKGKSAINLGVGFGNTIYTGGNYKMGFPTISVSYEIGILEVAMGSSLKGVVGVGGLIGYGGSRYNNSYSYWGSGYGYDVRTNYFLFAARGNYHFIFLDKLDTYAGIILGYYTGNSKVTYDANYPSSYPTYSGSDGGFHGGAYAGARWFFTPAIAAFAEVGWSISILTIGGTFKF